MTTKYLDQLASNRLLRTGLTWTLSILISLAGVVSYAGHVRPINLFSPIFYLAFGLAISLVYLLLTRLIQPAWSKWSFGIRWITVGISILVAAVIILIGSRFFQFPTRLAWQWDVGAQAGQPALLTMPQDWGEVPMPVLVLHPTDQPDNPNLPNGPWRASADLSGIYDGLAKRLSLKVTQPPGGIRDPLTQQIALPGTGDGVTVMLKVERAGNWQVVQQVHLDFINQPDQRQWHRVEAELPADAQRLALEALPGPPGSSIYYDTVWIGLENITPIGNELLTLLFKVTDLIGLSFLGLSILALSLTLPTKVDEAFNPEANVSGVGVNGPAGGKSQWFIPSKLLRLYLLITIIIAIAAVPVAIILVPWFYGATTSVQLSLEAPFNSDLELCWDEAAQECLPLVPNGNPNVGLNAQLWLTELPPRPGYHLTLIFHSPLNRAALRGLTLQPQPMALRIMSATDWGAERSFTPQDSASLFMLQDMQVRYRAGAFYLSSAAGGRLSLRQEIRSGPIEPGSWAPISRIWLLLVGSWLLIGGIALPLLRQDIEARRFPSTQFFPSPPKWWLIVGLVATAVHLLLVANAPVILHYSDPLNYMVAAKTMIEEGFYINPYRLPGYSLLLAIFFQIFSYHLNIITLLQAAMFDVAALILTWSLRRWLHPAVSAVGLLAIILSPVQVYYSMWILSESAFVTFALLALAALFAHLNSQGLRAKGWLLLYAVLVASAFMIRLNSIVLLAALIPAVLPGLWGLLGRADSWWDKVKTLLYYTSPYLLVITLLIGTVSGWSAWNYLNYGHFEPSFASGHGPMLKLITAGVFDARGLLDIDCTLNQGCLSKPGSRSPYYDFFITTRHNGPYFDPVFSMRSVVRQALTEQSGQLADNFQISHTLQEIGEHAALLLPWQPDVMSLLRSGWAAFGWRNHGNYFRVDPIDQATLQQHRQILRTYISPGMIYDERGENWLVSNYNTIAQNYGWYYYLFILALLSGMVILWRYQPILAIPWFVFMANNLLFTYLRVPEMRYIRTVDVCLIFQCMLGLSLLLRLQPTLRIWTFFKQSATHIGLNL